MNELQQALNQDRQALEAVIPLIDQQAKMLELMTDTQNIIDTIIKDALKRNKEIYDKTK